MPRSLNSDFPARLVVTLAIRGYLVKVGPRPQTIKHLQNTSEQNQLWLPGLTNVRVGVVVTCGFLWPEMGLIPRLALGCSRFQRTHGIQTDRLVA